MNENSFIAFLIIQNSHASRETSLMAIFLKKT